MFAIDVVQIYTLLQTSQMPGMCSTVYGDVYYECHLIRVAVHSPDFRLVANCHSVQKAT